MVRVLGVVGSMVIGSIGGVVWVLVMIVGGVMVIGGWVVACEGDGELAICAKLAQAPADHSLRWQKTSDEVEVGLW